MKANHTDITIVLDRSGSMASVADDTIGGFNIFLKDQKDAPGTASISLHQFDDCFETLIDGQEIKSAKGLTNKTFIPRGSTALLDAIGKAINITGSRLEKEAAEKVVFVIITDGHENASHQFSRDKVFEMITHQKTKYNWEFVFIGADQDAIDAGAGIGISADMSMSNAKNSVGTQSLYASAGANLKSFRSGTKVSMSWTADDKDAQLKAGLDPKFNK